MNVTGKFLLAFLCISIASYGLSGSAYASSHNLLPLSVATNSDSYAAGDTILIFGSIRDYDGKYPDVTIQIFGPLGGLKMIKQLAVDSDGSFSFTAIAAGTINLTGEYIVKAMWNKQPAEAMFEFVGGVVSEPEPVIHKPEPQLPEAKKTLAKKSRKQELEDYEKEYLNRAQRQPDTGGFTITEDGEVGKRVARKTKPRKKATTKTAKPRKKAKSKTDSCVKCGAKISTDDVFCTNCGSKK